MKNLLSVIIMLLGFSFHGKGQNYVSYVVKIHIKEITGSAGYGTYISASIEYRNGSKSSLLYPNGLNTYQTYGDNLIKHLKIETNGYAGSQIIDIAYPCMNEEKTINLGGFKVTYAINVEIQSLKIVEYNYYTDGWHNIGAGIIYLINDRPLGLAAQNIITANGNSFSDQYSDYTWEANIGGTWYTMGWKSTAFLYFALGEYFPENFSGYQGDFKDIVQSRQPVYVRVKSGCGDISNAIPLQPQLSAPTIDAVIPITETCYKKGDGQLIINFSRALYENEMLQVLAVRDDFSVQETENVPAMSASCTIDSLNNGNYNIILNGKYPYNPSGYDRDRKSVV
jgi:hypothetical protein